MRAVEAELTGGSCPRPPRPPPPCSSPRRRPAPPPPVVTSDSAPRPRNTLPSTKRPAPAPPPTPLTAGSGTRVAIGNTPRAQRKSKSPKSPPPRPKEPDLEDHRCRLNLDDETIAKALLQIQTPPAHGGGGGRGGRGGGESTRTTSSDSDLDSDFVLGPERVSGLSSVPGLGEDSSDEEEFEENYGVGLEAGLEARLRPSRVLPRALKGRLSRVSGMLGSLMTPERRAVRRVARLSRDKRSYFGALVQDYLSFVREGRGCHTTAEDFLQTLRQFLTQMKNYLRQSSELDPPLEALIPEQHVDSVLEKAMHKSVLKPLKNDIDHVLHNFQVRSGAWQQLKENLTLVKSKSPQDLGVDRSAVPPDPETIQKIRLKFLNMRSMYSPEKKVSVLLRVCKRIYSIMQEDSGRLYGADDFLPMLTFVVAQVESPALASDVLYMMELLDPELLQGEGGYYLTSLFGAVSMLRTFRAENTTRVLSSETRTTLQQWHQRRTAPPVDHQQNFLRISFQDGDSPVRTKTLRLRPQVTAEEVGVACAREFSIPDPEGYALFLVTPDSSQQLAPDTHPQRIRSDLQRRSCTPNQRIRSNLQCHSLSPEFCFVYRSIPTPSLPPNPRMRNDKT